MRTSLASDVLPQGDPAGVRVDADAGVVQLPAGTSLDPGGLGKGLAADIVTAELLAAGARGALVEIGGDVRVRGVPPEPDRWAIELRPDSTDGPSRIVDLVDGAVATSTTRLRTWRWNGLEHHHLVDPSTLTASARDVVSCTVVAGSGAWAEAFTKVAFATGAAGALERYAAHGLAASVTTADGALHTTPAWKDFLR
jgi:thiamine biosynthesis lipoprotein